VVVWIRYEDGQEIYNVACPMCNKILNLESDDKKIEVDITSQEGMGKLFLSAIWGDYSHTSIDVNVTKGEVVEMNCPHCKKSLLSPDKCEDCGATTTMFNVSEGHVKICNRRGCRMHLKFQLTGE
jgi:hypothetical protein